MDKDERVRLLDRYWRAVNYISVAQLYLKRNALLHEPLRASDIKPRLLGHWGTVPGLNFIYAHLNRLIQDTDAEVLLVVGPGHGAPGILANLYLEGTLKDYYPEFTQDAAGADRFARAFSWPNGMPSHLTPSTPGTIQEGGELGYCLVHSYGAALDNPGLIAACVIGDGEAETGPLAASWQFNRFLNPARDGAVLPILHLNGYKISGPTIMGRMSDDELTMYFEGMGYGVHLVRGSDPEKMHNSFWVALDFAYDEIRRIQFSARSIGPEEKPRWPIVILATPKGWTGPKTLHGEPVEGHFRSHQIPIKNVPEDNGAMEELSRWLNSYRPEELFDANGAPKEEVLSALPRPERVMGRNPHANNGVKGPLKLPDLSSYAIDVATPGGPNAESTWELGKYLRDVFRENEADNDFRVFCPDELDSNRLKKIFETTQRAFMWPLIDTDVDISKNGRAVEVLSEHFCQGALEGYILTGRHGVMVSYEAFVTIIDSMFSQYAKWLKVSREIPWRRPVASFTYLLTSHSWRQDHNGYSHQGPGFIDTLLTKKSSVIRIYLPPDANTLLHAFAHCLEGKGFVNLVIASKQEMPQWLSFDEAGEHFLRGASVWEWASTGHGEHPDVVMASSGDVPTLEALAAASILRERMTELKIRFVNVVDLLSLSHAGEGAHGLDDESFRDLFTDTAPVVFAFHGYPRVIHELIYRRPNAQRFHVRGYIEEGATTTPFDMVVANGISRYHLAIEALRRTPRLRTRALDLISELEEKLIAHREYIIEHGVDMPEVMNWRWTQVHELTRA
ncbi:MAG: phosphoketolase family protein [Deltaproteobacteria bacterium]|nr:phosphoketolase family protein [Deltaproteobacteria bacterium]